MKKEVTLSSTVGFPLAPSLDRDRESGVYWNSVKYLAEVVKIEWFESVPHFQGNKCMQLIFRNLLIWIEKEFLWLARCYFFTDTYEKHHKFLVL